MAAFIFYLKSTFSALALECEGSSGKCEVWSVKEAVGSEKCEVWSVKFKFGVRSAQCEVWSVRFGVWRKQWEVRSVKCGLWSAKCEVRSVKFQVRSAKSAVWSVECEDFASSLAEKIKRLSREGHGRDRVSLNYRSFMFGKLPPPACPGLCYNILDSTGWVYNIELVFYLYYSYYLGVISYDTCIYSMSWYSIISYTPVLI